MKITIKDPWDHKEVSLDLVKTRYQDGTPALLLNDADGSPYAKLSINVIEMKLPKGEYFIKNYSENEDLYRQLIAQGILVETGDSIPAGFVRVPVCRLNELRLKGSV